MAKMVKVMNSCLVPPALPTPKSPIWLSNLDLFAPPTHVSVVYFFRNCSSDPFPSPAASIKASLARVLVPYYPFAGRFTKSTLGRLEIRCTDEGALFFEAISDLTLDEFGVYKPSPENCSLLVPTDGLSVLEKRDDSVPILMVQLTTFKCGSLCLGTALHHQATDGIAAMRFMCDWADATRDPTRPIPTPCMDRTSLRARSPPTVQFHHPEFDLRERPEKQQPISCTYLDVTPAQLVAVKALCGDKYTCLESVAAHIWRCMCLAQGPTQPDEEIRLMMTADLRRRLSHMLPSDLVGNAVTTTVAIASAAEVAAGLRPARIREAIEKLEEEYLRSAVDYLELEDDKRRLARAAGNLATTDILVGSWNRLPLYEVDFGWGPPEFMGPAAITFPRLFVILSSPGGGVKVCCSVETEKMDCFVKFFHELLPVAVVNDSDLTTVTN